MRPINADELKELYSGDGLYTAAHFRTAIDEMPTASPWRRVEDDPKDEGKYLVYDGRGNYHVVWWGPRLGWCYDPKFFCYWMPIEPPKEDA